MTIPRLLHAALLRQRGGLFAWVPVCLAIGVGLYFHFKSEPSLILLIYFAGGGGLLILAARWSGAALAPLVVGAGLVLVGLCLAGARAHIVAGPVLGWRYYGPIEGRIIGLDRSASDAERMVLDRVVLRDVAPARTPQRVRISLHSNIDGTRLRPGLTVLVTGHLVPPSGPVEPGGFDFQRHAWFQGLGGVGYTRVPVVALAPSDGTQPLFAARMGLSARVQAAFDGEAAGAFAAAIMTGDRSGIGQAALQALRVSNLAHLLAISGLHMGLLAGFVFGAMRLLLSLSPWLALRLPVKPLSAGLALCVSAGYLALSGGSVATERAFVMVAVVLAGVILNRRALSLRAVALAAVIVLCMRPESLLGPGFQMSFAATTALVVVFGWLKTRQGWLGPRWLRPAVTVLISSFVAGAATAPVAAAHFNQIAHFGLIANLLTVPLMGVLVMPAAVLAACLLPFGLEGAALWLMGLGLRWILGVAHWVAGLEGARGTVVRPDPGVLPLLAVGVLLIILVQGRARYVGVVPVLLGLMLWVGAERPEVLISDTGALVGVMTDEGRALSAAKGAGFVAKNWLENDGDAAGQDMAARRWRSPKPGAIPVVVLKGKRAAQRVTEADCTGKTWLVLTASPPPGLDCPRVIHPGLLRKTGALALYQTDKGIRMVSARQHSGTRLWNMR